MKIAFLYGGYANQYVGMIKELYDESRLIQEYFEEASNCLNTNFVKLCFASSDAELAAMHEAYTSLFLVSSSLAALLKQEGITPSLVAGYDTGQLAAAHTAQSLSLPDGLYLLSKYAGLYQELCTQHSYSAITVRSLSITQVEDIVAAVPDSAIAYYLSPDTHGVAGTTEGIDRIAAQVKERGGSVDTAPIELGLHSLQMESIVQQLTTYAFKVDFKSTEGVLLDAATGKPVTESAEIKAACIDDIARPVVWNSVMHTVATECDLVVAIGPGTYIGTLFAQQHPTVPCVTINTRADIEVLKEKIQQVNLGTGEPS